MAGSLRQLSEYRGYWLTYRELARGVYETREPSRAQIEAVARAARRLEGLGYVILGHPYEDDQRLTCVTLP